MKINCVCGSKNIPNCEQHTDECWLAQEKLPPKLQEVARYILHIQSGQYGVDEAIKSAQYICEILGVQP